MTDQAPVDLAAKAAAARRQCLYLFLHLAFKVLFPGQKLFKADYLETLCWELQELWDGRTRRLVINMVPRNLKSIVASVVFPAWAIGRDPEKQVLVACYGDTLARDQSILFRKLTSSAFYRATFPGLRLRDRAGRLHEFRTDAGGGRRAVTLGGAVTGLGADLIVVDDLMKASDATSDARRREVREFFDQTLLSRLNDKKNGGVVAIQQRLHPDDLPAHLLEKDGYRHLNFPAVATEGCEYELYYGHSWRRAQGSVLCPGREDADTLDSIRREIGDRAFQAQYQQDPVAGGVSMVDAARLHLMPGSPDDYRFLKTVQTWDTAIKVDTDSDYSVCATFGWDGTRWVLADVLRERLEFGDLKLRALQLRWHWRAEDVIVEGAASGLALVQDMRRNAFYEFTALSVNEPKEARFAVAADWLHSGRIGILNECAWYPDLRREILDFPSGRHDDQVDAISLFVKKQRGRRAIDPEATRRSRARDTRDQRRRESFERQCRFERGCT